MTSWVVWQDTDFCATWWEERIYNAVVGVIYCFTFFNLKEGKSRYGHEPILDLLTFWQTAMVTHNDVMNKFSA